MTSNNHIDESQLTKVKEIGEGAFATGEVLMSNKIARARAVRKSGPEGLLLVSYSA